MPDSAPHPRVERTPRAIAAIAAALILTASFAGCARRRADAAPVAPPVAIPASAPALDPPRGPLSEPQTRAELPPPQSVPEGAAPAPRGPFAYEAPGKPQEPESPRPARTTARPAPETPPAPAEVPQQTPAPASVPQLGPLISQEQRQVLQKEIDRNSELTRAALSVLMGRKLTADQIDGVQRIRQFLRQVEESREADAALARNLSERARLLAEDLVRNTR